MLRPEPAVVQEARSGCWRALIELPQGGGFAPKAVIEAGVAIVRKRTSCEPGGKSLMPTSDIKQGKIPSAMAGRSIGLKARRHALKAKAARPPSWGQWRKMQ